MDATNSRLGDAFDAAVRSLEGIPDVVNTKAATLRVVHPVLSIAQTFIVQTYRHPERGDTILIEYVGADGTWRLALPQAVADTIARQRDALVTKNRKRGARKAVETRRAKGTGK